MGVNRDHVNNEIHVFPLVVCFINVFVCETVFCLCTCLFICYFILKHVSDASTRELSVDYCSGFSSMKKISPEA